MSELPSVKKALGVKEREVKKCYFCDVEMQFAEKVPFRIKGTPGFWKLIVGEWAELGEEMLSLDVYVCTKCGEVRLFADEKAKQSLLKLTPKAFLKNCVACGKVIPIASEKCPYCDREQK
jgi:predicted RNA-binding Zn-ribbon protein involved in translation (DUF1610 family)